MFNARFKTPPSKAKKIIEMGRRLVAVSIAGKVMPLVPKSGAHMEMIMLRGPRAEHRPSRFEVFNYFCQEAAFLEQPAP